MKKGLGHIPAEIACGVLELEQLSALLAMQYSTVGLYRLLVAINWSDWSGWLIGH